MVVHDRSCEPIRIYSKDRSLFNHCCQDLFLLFAGWLHLQPGFQPALAWFKNAESRLNHHLAGLFGVSSLAWTRSPVPCRAIPESRGQPVRWDNFFTTLPHPQGLAPFFSGNWAAYAQNPDSRRSSLRYCRGCRHCNLTFLGGFSPKPKVSG